MYDLFIKYNIHKHWKYKNVFYLCMWWSIITEMCDRRWSCVCMRIDHNYGRRSQCVFEHVFCTHLMDYRQITCEVAATMITHMARLFSWYIVYWSTKRFRKFPATYIVIFIFTFTKHMFMFCLFYFLVFSDVCIFWLLLTFQQIDHFYWSVNERICLTLYVRRQF